MLWDLRNTRAPERVSSGKDLKTKMSLTDGPDSQRSLKGGAFSLLVPTGRRPLAVLRQGQQDALLESSVRGDHWRTTRYERLVFPDHLVPPKSRPARYSLIRRAHRYPLASDDTCPRIERTDDQRNRDSR